MKKKFFTILVCLMLIASVAYGSIIHVPGDQSTIQAGIDAAEDGDTVLVADGTWTGPGNKNLDFGGKAITVESENGAENCTIDCQNNGRGFYFHSGEGSGSVVNGFTIKNGVSDYGGGIVCLESSPTITNCTITRNKAGSGGGISCSSSSPSITNCTITRNQATYGGGISCSSSSPSITNCTITGNQANGYGGGIRCYYSSPRITNCTITGNQATYGGGGVSCRFSSSPRITNCIITGNQADYYGGGIECLESSPTLTNCTITGNQANEYSGGGISCRYSDPTLTNCTITGNQANRYGGGIECLESSPRITNCTITGNQADYYGGGIRCYAYSPTITNCTITGNESSKGGGIYCFSSSSPTITNCILWGDTPDEVYDDGGSFTPTITYSDVQGGWEGEGNIDANPLFVDPDNGNYHLNDYSPCIGAGTSEGAPTTDIEGNPRGTPPDIGAYENSRDIPLAVTLTSLTATTTTDSVTLEWRTATETNNLGFNIYRSDTKDGKYTKVNARLIQGVGTDATPHDYSFTDENIKLSQTYYYYIEDVDFSGKTNKSHIIEVTVGKQGIKTHFIPPTFALLQNYPNPFNPETWIPYQLSQDASVTISIYNIKGQLVRTLHLGNQNAGVYITKGKAVYWDGKDAFGEKVASGVHYYTLRAGEFRATRKMVILK